jgi:hypothetical protein
MCAWKREPAFFATSARNSPSELPPLPPSDALCSAGARALSSSCSAAAPRSWPSAALAAVACA